MAENYHLELSEVQCHEIYDACKPMYEAEEILEVEYYGFTICVSPYHNNFSGFAVQTEHLETMRQAMSLPEEEWDSMMNENIQYQCIIPQDETLNYLLDADCDNKYSVFAALAGWVARVTNDRNLS